MRMFSMGIDAELLAYETASGCDKNTAAS